MSVSSPPPEHSPELTASPSLPGGDRRGLVVTVVIVVSCLLAAGAFGVWALSGADDDGDVASASDANGAAEHIDHDGNGGHRDEQVLEGCDPAAYHNTMMMFDPFAADGLLESGCPWPYVATIALDGGRVNPDLASEFEPRRYSEIFDLIGTERYGMCSVASLPDESLPDQSESGFVFGFEVALNEAGCAGGVSTFQVVMREYATRAWRDSAAAVAASDVVSAGAGDAVVLGRWVVSVIGADSATVGAFVAQLAAIGASPVSV